MADPCLPSQILIRPATEADIASTTTIINHYINHTTANFAEQPIELEQNLASFRLNTVQAGYPYLVAVEHGSVVGYTKLSPFRAGTKSGYKITAELSLFVDPTKVSSGIGSLLLQKLIDVLLRPEGYGPEWLGERRRGEGRIRNVISCMGVDPALEREGEEKLAKYYERFGFERAGRLRGVAVKFGRSLDAIYLQKTFP